MLGTAITVSRLSSGKENTAPFSPLGIFFSRFITASNASAQLTPWQIKVAHATPATPIFSAVTNRMSMPMLEREDTARKIKGVLLSPMAEKMPVAIL